MVRIQIENRGIRDSRVLQAMRDVPRHLFVPEGLRRHAYNDHALPIGYGQTISQPYIVALMTHLLDVKEGDRILEIGTGSGYQAAVLSELTGEVYTLEIIDELAAAAAVRFTDLGYPTITSKQGDGYYGWEEEAPFDGIIVTAAAGHVPPDLIEQLKPGGVMVIPIGRQFEVQYLTVIEKKRNGTLLSRQILPVQFVPFTGRAQRSGP